MGLTDIVDITEYMPRWLKYLVFLLIISMVASLFNALLLFGKGYIVCDSNRDAYILEETPKYISVMSFLLDYETKEQIKASNDIIHRIERKRAIEQGEQNSLVIWGVPYDFKNPFEGDIRDCVKCHTGNDSDCRTTSGSFIKYEQMVKVDTPNSFWDTITSSSGSTRQTCSFASMETSSERMNMTIPNMNESFYNLYVSGDTVKWDVEIYNLDTSIELDELIHANGDLYKNYYQRDDNAELTTKLLPIGCTNDYEPQVTFLGLPLFQANFWIIGTIIFVMFGMLTKLKVMKK